MTTTHTPGPWIVQKFPDGEIRVAQADTFADIAGCSEQNARLIAAAPELLEALRAIVPAFEELLRANGLENPESAPFCAAARAAIAKATA